MISFSVFLLLLGVMLLLMLGFAVYDWTCDCGSLVLCVANFAFVCSFV